MQFLWAKNNNEYLMQLIWGRLGGKNNRGRSNQRRVRAWSQPQRTRQYCTLHTIDINFNIII